MRRSAHRRKRLNKTDLTKTNDTTNYYKKCGAAAKAAAPSAGREREQWPGEGESELEISYFLLRRLLYDY